MHLIAIHAPARPHHRREQAPVLLAVPGLHLPADQPQLLRSRRLVLCRRRGPLDHGRRDFGLVIGFGNRDRLVVLFVLVEVHALEVDGEPV